MKKLFLFAILSVLFLLNSCKDNNQTSYVIDCTYEKEVEKNKVVVSNEEKNYLKNYITENGITATLHDLGFYYTIIEPGDDVKLEMCYEVSATYKCYTLDGKYIDFGTNAAFGLYIQTTILGFRVGMTTVGKGGKVMLYLPPSLAYGEKGADPAIGPNEYLIFEVEIVDARKKITYY